VSATTAEAKDTRVSLKPKIQEYLWLQHSKLIAQDTRNKMAAARGTAAGVDSELDRYMQKTTDVATRNGLLFWEEREHSYPLLAPLAKNFISATASQAYIERVFSVCGDSCCL